MSQDLAMDRNHEDPVWVFIMCLEVDPGQEVNLGRQDLEVNR